jgi:hypothetical protein
MIDDEIESGSPPRPSGGREVLEAILSGASTTAAKGMFSEQSRYAGVATATIELPSGPDGVLQKFVYLRRRFVPDPSRFAAIRTHIVAEGERMDHIAARELNDPLAFWKLCDANGVMSPLDSIGAPGTRLRVPLPEGVKPESLA